MNLCTLDKYLEYTYFDTVSLKALNYNMQGCMYLEYPNQ